MGIHEKYMARALELAALAKGKTSPNPMVGAVIVKGDEVVGEGYHHQAGLPHAEVEAIRDSGDHARGATIYVTLEPCSHYGRTPPCTKAIIEAGISKVVVAMTDPNPLVAGRGLKQLRDAGIEVIEGILTSEAQLLNEVFIKYITTKTPFVALKSAVTLDGKIASRSGQSKWITGEGARAFGHRLRNIYDGILVGVGTLIADNPSLTTRIPDLEGKDPIRIVLDSKARTPIDSNIFNRDSKSGVIIVTTSEAPQEKVKKLIGAGATIITTPSNQGRVDIKYMLNELGKQGITSILIEGGGKVSGAFLQERLIDKFYWFIAPKLLGDTNFQPIAGWGAEIMEEAVILEGSDFKLLGEDILVTGYPSKELV